MTAVALPVTHATTQPFQHWISSKPLTVAPGTAQLCWVAVNAACHAASSCSDVGHEPDVAVAGNPSSGQLAPEYVIVIVLPWRVSVSWVNRPFTAAPRLPLLAPTQDKLDDLGPLLDDIRVHLDAGYDSQTTRDELATRGMTGQIAHKGDKAPIQAGQRWHVERTNSWQNGFNRLQR
jgi:hypothetical protein